MCDDFPKIAIIPVYHDICNAVEVLSKFRDKIVDEICVIVDCADKAGLDQIARVASKIQIPIHVISNQERKGVGVAIRKGIDYGLSRGYEIAVVMAGNNKDDPSEISRLVDPILENGYDYVQGSRFLPGGRRVKNPFLRGVFSRLFPFFWTLLTNVRCTDVTNGFRAYKLKILSDKRIDIWQGWLDSYELEYYIHYKVLTLGYKMKEVAVSKVYPHRYKGGYSNISPFRDWWKIVGPLICLKIGAKK